MKLRRGDRNDSKKGKKKPKNEEKVKVTLSSRDKKICIRLL